MQTAAMSSGLQRRLLLLLLIPLFLLACINTWFDYRSADNAALQQDRQLLKLVPLLADSVVSGKSRDDLPVMLAAPAVEVGEFAAVAFYNPLQTFAIAGVLTGTITNAAPGLLLTPLPTAHCPPPTAAPCPQAHHSTPRLPGFLPARFPGWTLPRCWLT